MPQHIPSAFLWKPEEMLAISRKVTRASFLGSFVHRSGTGNTSEEAAVVRGNGRGGGGEASMHCGIMVQTLPLHTSIYVVMEVQKDRASFVMS